MGEEGSKVGLDRWPEMRSICSSIQPALTDPLAALGWEHWARQREAADSARVMAWRGSCAVSQRGMAARPRGGVTPVSSVHRPVHHRISGKGRGRSHSDQIKVRALSRACHQAEFIHRRNPFITVSVSPTRILNWRVFEGGACVGSCEPHSEEAHQGPGQGHGHTQVGLGLHFFQLLCVRC